MPVPPTPSTAPRPTPGYTPGRLNGAWFVLAAAILWGTTGTSQALAPAAATPAAIGALRLAFGGFFLLILAASRRSFSPPQKWPVAPTLIAALSMAAYQLCFFAGVSRTGVAVGTIVGIGSSPILAGMIAFLVRREPPGWRWAAATALAVIGSSLLLLAGTSLRLEPSGILLAVGAGASYAVFTVASKTLLETRPPEAVMAVSFSLGALLLSPLLFFADLSWLRQPAGLLVTLHLGLLTVALAYTLFAYGLQRLPVAAAATLTLAEPLTAGLLGVFLLGERLTPPAWLGVALIFAGLALLSLRQNSAKQ